LLNLPGITSKFCTIAMFVTANTQNLFHMKFVYMLLICPNTTYHTPSFNGSFVIVI